MSDLASSTTTPVSKTVLTWEDYGCKPNDPSVDNAPIISQMISDQAARKLKVAPVGTLADYHIKTPINWPGVYGCALEGSGGYSHSVGLQNIGCTRVIWNGPNGGTMMNYRGCGGRLGRVMLCGSNWNGGTTQAGTGIMVSANIEPPSGNLITDQLAIVNCDVGMRFLATPDNNHADQMKHFGLLFHGVKTCYWVEGEQSCPHRFFDIDVRNGWDTVFKFDKGGALDVYGCYIGGDNSGKLQTLLYLTQPNYNNGWFNIAGIQVDNSVKNIRLLDHDWVVPGVTMRGSACGNPNQFPVYCRYITGDPNTPIGQHQYIQGIDIRVGAVNIKH